MSERIAVLTDVHIDPDDADAFERLERRFEAVAARDPDELVVLGDVLHYETDGHERERLERFVSVLDETGLPYRCVPGNHDVGELDLAAFTDVVGHGAWAVDEASETVYLDSTAPHLGERRSEVGEEQLAALGERVGEMDAALVFVHHPVHYHDIRDNRWFGDHPEEAFCANKRAVVEALAPDSVAAVLNGHLHEFAVTDYRGVLHVTVDVFDRTGDPDATTGAFAIVERGDRLSVTHVADDGKERVVRRPLGR